MLQIGSLQLKSNVVFAPIAGFSDAGARYLAARYGAGLLYTEMVSAKGLCYNNKGTAELLRVEECDVPTAVQIFGHEPEFMYKASKDERLARFDMIDINMGCPVRKVYGSGDGSALMQDTSLVTEVVRAVKEGSKKTVSVKIRAGIAEPNMLAVDVALAAQKGGADCITVHPRYREQMYSGIADHRITASVKNAVSIPVIASGDIVDLQSLRQVQEISGADGYMIARGALGRPWIFAELRGEDYEYDAKETILKHIEILRGYLPDSVVANVMKTQLCHYAKNAPNAKSVRVAVTSIKTIDQLFVVVDEFFGVKNEI